MKISTLVLDRTNIIVAGRWNQAILTPEWLVSNIPALSDLAAPAPEFQMPLAPLRMRIGFPNIFIKPEIDSLIVEARNNTSECFDDMTQTLSEIYQKLSHTPISAIGHNFTFSLDDNEALILTDNFTIEQDIIDKLPREYASNASSSSSQIHCGIEKPEWNYILNIYFERVKNKADVVQLNFHHNLSDDGNDIENIIVSYQSNFVLAKEILESVIRIKE